ncbi:MAG: hypothetical protein JWL67_646 [Solirubrobacterales bacterium]|nr:hypothetical protein [Solirubrobacterales bacterium]
MNATTSPPSATAASAAAGHPSTGAHAQTVPAEACPLCGAPLHAEQEWCLNCGAAARTRLAATPNWKVPIAVLLAVVALSLGVLAAAFVQLAGSGATPPATTKTVTTAPAPAAPAPGGVVPSTAVPGAAAPGGVAPVPATPGATTPGAATPGITTPGTTSVPGATPKAK